MKLPLFLLAVAACSPVLAQLPPGADLAQRTVVLYNDALPASKQLAEYYAQKRQIPTGNLVGLKCSEGENIHRTDYEATIEDPLRAEFAKRGWWEIGDSPGGKICTKTKMRVIAIMRGVPLRIAEKIANPVPDPKTGKKPEPASGPGHENGASVDSELMALGIIEKNLEGPLKNPYFQKNDPFLALPLAPIFLTGRIDGPTEADARRLIDDALAVEKGGLYGRVYIDLALKTDGNYKEGEEWLVKAARTFGLSGFPVIVDSRAATFPENYPMRDCALYLGWYQLPPDGPFLHPSFKFKTGAVACHIHSFSATSVRSTKEGWLGLMISQGAAAALGNVFEPYLSLTAHLDIFSDRLLRGFTVAEAQAMSLPGISWMSTLVGDPLYRPFNAPIAEAPEDKDYRLLRLTMKEHSEKATDNADFLTKLTAAAGKLNSGSLWESVALLRQGLDPSDRPAITAIFNKAVAAYRDPADKIRAELLQAEWHVAGKEQKEATRVLADAAKLAEKLPEAKAVQMMRMEWKLDAKN